MLREGKTWATIITATGCSRATLAKIAKDHVSARNLAHAPLVLRRHHEAVIQSVDGTTVS